jgi:tRNA dimethylallyltransferase
MSATPIPVLCLLGPTASGKTGLAVELCQQLPVDIVSVDSALIYRGMDIGTAKPDAATLNVAPHALIDIIDPWETYSVSRFLEDVQREIAAITANGRIPLLVGGTMLYFKSLWHGLSDLPESDSAVRSALQAQADRDGWDALHAELARVDPVSAARIHKNDPQRLLRALEVFRVSGKPLSQLQNQRKPDSEYDFFNIGIHPSDRAVLHSVIATRYDQMLEQGLVDEVTQLMHMPAMHRDLPSMRCVGYRQVCAMLNDEYSHAEMRERGIAATRQLAKRQITWMRGMQELLTLDLAPRLADLQQQASFREWLAASTAGEG